MNSLSFLTILKTTVSDKAGTGGDHLLPSAWYLAELVAENFDKITDHPAGTCIRYLLCKIYELEPGLIVSLQTASLNPDMTAFRVINDAEETLIEGVLDRRGYLSAGKPEGLRHGKAPLGVLQQSLVEAGLSDDILVVDNLYFSEQGFSMTWSLATPLPASAIPAPLGQAVSAAIDLFSSNGAQCKAKPPSSFAAVVFHGPFSEQGSVDVSKHEHGFTLAFHDQKGRLIAEVINLKVSSDTAEP